MNELQQAYDRIIRPIEDLMIRSISRIVRHPQDVEDAMQEALLTVSRRWNRISRHPNPQALVLKICVDTAYDFTRRTSRHRRTVELTEVGNEQCDFPRSLADEMVRAERYAEIMAAIHRLPRQQAVATLMRVVQELPYEQVAAALGCTEATARKHVARSRERLRVWLAHLDPANRDGGSS